MHNARIVFSMQHSGGKDTHFSTFVSEFHFWELALRLKTINDHIYVCINVKCIYLFTIYCMTF